MLDFFIFFQYNTQEFVCILNKFFMRCEVYAHVTKHGNQCPSPAPANWIRDGLGINFIEMYAYEKCSLFIQSRVQSRVASNSKVLRKKRINLIKI